MPFKRTFREPVAESVTKPVDEAVAVPEVAAPVAAVAPGPGDTVGPITYAAAPAAPLPLGPGDSVPGEVLAPAPLAAKAEGPGDGPESEFEVRAAPAFGPGDVDSPRAAIRIPRRRSSGANALTSTSGALTWPSISSTTPRW